MSLELVREVSREHPDLLPRNIGSSCYQHTVYLVEKLKAAGHIASLTCKSPGEGQYVPPGFQPRIVKGLDGKDYPCSGVSHDAIWCDGKQYDTLGSANENDRPIYRSPGDPNWSFNPNDGPQITASPMWNEIPQQYWRVNNPPFAYTAPTPPPTPQPTPPPQPGVHLPSYAELGDDVFFRAMIGVPLFADYLMANQSPNDGMSVWFSRAIYRLMAAFINANGKPVDAAGEVKIVRNEWRGLLGLPPL
jgi:hypothetical protein